ncbi:DUF6531 domain-containing protein [Diaphorobacter aerolatus]|uniref:RHS repeat protein n=1 Tax=Diaphorobacter aerolatus TaxID=1288495 RepID=A0A7H0GGY2_9BURK|nr:DUF6531 domain-containing protein [Diaphorobacter aerolatus]QNP47548.1 RHS repeat protein [Diaphorobacter aerolatus]
MGKPEQAEKRVEHYAMAKAPDWKYTPAKPNKGTPVPYWTIAYFNLSVKTAPNSEGRGNDYFIARSRAPVSVRGELGRGGGVKSGTYMEEFEPSEWSNTLVISGSGAVFDGHKGWINKRNAPAKVYTNVNPDVAIADKACWEQLQTNLSALGISTVDKMKADPGGCGKEVLGGAWGSISGDAKAAGDMLGSIWGGITSFFSDPVGSIQSAASELKKYGQQAYEAGKQVAELVKGLSDGSITMDDLLEFAGDMLQDALCSVAQKLEQMVKDGKGCEAIGYLLGQVATTIALTMAGGAVAGKAAQGATKAAEMMTKMGISKGDSLAEMIRKMKKYKKDRKEVGGNDHPSKPRTPTSDDSGTPGNKRNPQCPLCPVVGKRPVNPVLGVKVLAGGEDMDFNLPAPLPLPWQRTYVSNNGHAGWLGQGWSVPFSAHVVEKRTQKGIIFVLVDEFGRDIKFSYLTPGQSQLNRYEQIVLRMLDDGRLTLEGTNAEVKLTFTELPLAPRRTLRRFAMSAMEDRNGNAVSLVHNELGEPTHITDSAGRTLVLRFDDVGVATQRAVKPLRRLTAISWVDFVGNKAQHRPLVAYQYDDQGDLVAVLDRVGRVARQFEYRNHILVAHSVPGVAARYHYSIDSPKGKVLRSEISTGESFAFEYFKHHTQVTDNLGRVELYHFNEFKEWTGTTDAAGGFTERKLDGFGNLIGVTDPAGRTTRYAYDDKGRLTRVQEPNASLLDLNTISIGYDSKLGLPTEVTLADGAKTEYQYDEVGNLVKATDALGHVTRYALDQRGLPITVVDALGKSKLLRYNQSGQLIQYVDCSNQPTNYTYDVWAS